VKPCDLPGEPEVRQQRPVLENRRGSYQQQSGEAGSTEERPHRRSETHARTHAHTHKIIKAQRFRF